MSDWKHVAVGCLCVLLGIFLTHALFLYSRFHADSQGYMWRSARKLWGFLLPFFLAEWVVGCLLFLPVNHLIGHWMYPLIALVAAVIGFVVAIAPTLLELRYLPEEGATLASRRQPLTRLVLKLNLAMRHQFAWAIESCRQQDLYDCQHGDWLGAGLEWRHLRRRIRMLYESCKLDIATARGDSFLLFYDFDHFPEEKFYLLVRHLGRRRFRQYLKDSVSPTPTWKGNERRKRPGWSGTRADREDTVNNVSVCRVYDDKERLKAIDARRPRTAS